MHKPNSIFEAARAILTESASCASLTCKLSESVIEEGTVSPAIAKLVDKYEIGWLDEGDYDEDDVDIKKQVKAFQKKFDVKHRHIAFVTEEYVEENGASWTRLLVEVKKLTSSFMIVDDLTAQNQDSKVLYFV